MANGKQQFTVVAAIQVLVNHLENEALSVYMTDADTQDRIQRILADARKSIKNLLSDPAEERETFCPTGWCEDAGYCEPCENGGRGG